MDRHLLRGLLVAGLLALGACGGGDDDDDGPSRNPQLDALVVAGATLSPPFDSDVFDYTAEVANAVDSTTVTPTTAHPAATVTVNGTPVVSGSASAPIALPVGDTTITVLVTAENGTTQRAYAVVVTRRPPPSSNAALLELSLTGTELDQLFDPTVQSYTASLGYFGAFVRVVARPEDDGATLSLDGTPLPIDQPSAYVPLAPGTTTLEVLVTAEDGVATRAYSVAVTRAGPASRDQEAYVKASNTGPDQFASSVALSRDTLAVGAPEEGSAASGIDGDQSDNSLLDPGAVYLFERSGSSWMQTSYVKAADPGDPDRFGTALALSGDLLAVGAPGEQSAAVGVDGDPLDDSANGAGAVYLFGRDGMGVWEQAAYLKASNTNAGDEFGRAVATDGRRVMVGAALEDGAAMGVDGDDTSNALSAAGAAYLFERDDAGHWRQIAYLKAAVPDAGDQFGSAVAVRGRLAASGAPLEDSQASGVDGDPTSDGRSASGAVFVFEADDDGAWSPAAYLKASNTDAGDRFGTALALDGDLLAVGAPGEDSRATGVDGDESDDSLNGPGAVYVFERAADGDWSQIAYLKASNPGALDGFGSALALRGNVLVVAARLENSAASGIDANQADESALNAGAVYVFERAADGDWSQIAYLKASNTDAGDEFGGAVAFDGDTVAVGAPFEQSAETGVNGDELDNSVVDAGAAYVIR